MTNEQATRRYLAFVFPAAVLFVGASYAIKMADEASLLPEPALYAAAVLPVIILLALFWAQWRYMGEIDEFLRSIQIKATFVALTAVMTIATGWGYLEFYADAPRLSIFWLNPLYWIAFGVATVAISRRYGSAS